MSSSIANADAGTRLAAVLWPADETQARLGRHRDQILRLARLEDVDVGADLPEGAVQIVLGEATLALPLADVIDLGAERDRLAKEIAKLDKDIAGIDKKLANEKFLANAPEAVVAEQHERRAEAVDAKVKLEAALERLKVA